VVVEGELLSGWGRGARAGAFLAKGNFDLVEGARVGRRKNSWGMGVSRRISVQGYFVSKVKSDLAFLS
jgi:hypothetical protein